MDYFEEAVREAQAAISRQAARLDDVRSRAATVFGASVIASTIGGSAIKELDAESFLALGAFAAATVLTFLILVPSEGWRFVRTGSDVIAAYVDVAGELASETVARERVAHLDADYAVNDERLEQLNLKLRLLVAAVATETAVLIVGTVGTVGT